MSDKRKYKVIHPTNGYNEGDVVELTDAEAANYNGGESEPRVVLVEEGSDGASTPPAGEGESQAGSEGEGASSETDNADKGGENAGGDAGGESAGEGGEKGQE